jgi:hypothetical protein
LTLEFPLAGNLAGNFWKIPATSARPALNSRRDISRLHGSAHISDAASAGNFERLYREFDVPAQRIQDLRFKHISPPWNHCKRRLLTSTR